MLPSLLSLAAAILSIAKDKLTLAWAAFGLTAVFLLVRFGYPVGSFCRGVLIRYRDNRKAGQIWPELVPLIDRFSVCVDASRCDTIHHLLNSGQYPGSPDLSKAFQNESLVAMDILYGMWHHVRQHIQDTHRDFNHLYQSVEAFSWLLQTYSCHVVQLVFSRARHTLRPLLTDELRSSLELCRERDIGLIDDYTRFLERANLLFRGRKLTVPLLQRPGPF